MVDLRYTNAYGRARSQAAQTTGQQQRNRLQDLLYPMQAQQARQDNAAKEAQFFYQALGGDSYDPSVQGSAQQWTQARDALASAGADVSGISQIYDPNQFTTIKGLARSSTTSKGVQFGAQATFKDEAGNMFFGTQKRNPQTEEVETVLSSIGGGASQPVGQIQQVGAFGLTGQETVGHKADVAAAETKARQFETASDAYIQTGLEASDGLDNVVRAMKLLDVVNTGGWTNRAKLAAKQAFGIESADEGELNALMGRAVLSQLKAIFGSQFTQEEGKRLEGIEANWGKNAETNRRLLDGVMTTITRAAERGIRAAELAGDTFRANEIRMNLDAAKRSLQDAAEEQAEAPPQTQQDGGLTPEQRAELQRMRAQQG